MDGCVDNCMAYGSTIVNSNNQYTSYNLFYLNIRDYENTCKQCYFSSSSNSGIISQVGIFNRTTFTSAVYTSTPSLETGFTTCAKGFCAIYFTNGAHFNSFSIQALKSLYNGSTCVYNNSHCSSSGIISSYITLSYIYSSGAEIGSCDLPNSFN